MGAHISHYMLEISRICCQDIDNRNYHVFYILCAGASSSLKDKLELDNLPTFSVSFICTALFSMLVYCSGQLRFRSKSFHLDQQTNNSFRNIRTVILILNLNVFNIRAIVLINECIQMI